jgi:UDP-N-acetylmuramate dehydrogenase
MPRLILGGGSNIVLTGDFPGAVLHMATRGMRLAQADFETILVTAAGGAYPEYRRVWCGNQGLLA